MRECDFARNFWHLMSVPPDVVQSFQALDVVTWLRENCFSNAKHQSSVPWRFVFPFAIWELWKHRNKVSFENISLNPMLCKLCINQAMELFLCGQDQGIEKHGCHCCEMGKTTSKLV